MKLGGIYVCDTKKVEGYDQRKKYHIFICAKDNDEDHTFLFINSVDWFKDYKLLKFNYEFLSYDSFVGCNAVVTYSDEELASLKLVHVGQLTVQDLKGIRDAIISAKTMERVQSNRVCGALAAVL